MDLLISTQRSHWRVYILSKPTVKPMSPIAMDLCSYTRTLPQQPGGGGGSSAKISQPSWL